MDYFNTTNESGTTLKNNVAKAKSQEEIIYSEFLKDNKEIENNQYLSKKEKEECKGFSAYELSTKLIKYPITSIRRALTNLTKQGKLIKTNEKRIGMYGRSEYVWKLNENN